MSLKDIAVSLGLDDGAGMYAALVAAPLSPAPQPVAWTPPAAAPAGIELGPEDLERMKAIEAQVYASPSSYRVFQDVRASLGNTSDLGIVFGVLAATKIGVTPEKVISDIDAHLGVIAAKATEFDGALAKARTDRIDGPKHQAAELRAQNQEAAAAITARAAQADALDKAAQDAERAIADGSARFKMIADRLADPLTKAKQLLSQLPTKG